jgi:hypothetical protein
MPAITFTHGSSSVSLDVYYTSCIKTRSLFQTSEESITWYNFSSEILDSEEILEYSFEMLNSEEIASIENLFLSAIAQIGSIIISDSVQPSSLSCTFAEDSLEWTLYDYDQYRLTLRFRK